MSQLLEFHARTSSLMLKNIMEDSERIKNNIFTITIDMLKNFAWNIRNRIEDKSSIG